MAKVKKIFKFTYILFILSLLFVTSSFANSFNIQDLYLNNEEEFLLQINNDVNINFIYSKKYKQLANVIAKQIKNTHYVYENLLGSPKNFKLTIKLMNQEDFFNITNVPRWTNAIYFKKHIIFPIDDENQKFDIEFLKSLRHEYMHAFIYNLSNGKCASWFDEGIAQWAEGSTNPKLWNELEKFLEVHYALSFSNLENSYTTMPTYLVPVAYAESLFGIKYLIKNTDIKNFKKLFSLLNNGVSFNESFKNAFNLSVENFDYQISNILYKWKNSKDRKSFDDLINFSTHEDFNHVQARLEFKVFN